MCLAGRGLDLDEARRPVRRDGGPAALRRRDRPRRTDRDRQASRAELGQPLRAARPGLPARHGSRPRCTRSSRPGWRTCRTRRARSSTWQPPSGAAFTLDVLVEACEPTMWTVSLVHSTSCGSDRSSREHGASGYDFSHDKIREVAYAQMSACAPLVTASSCGARARACLCRESRRCQRAAGDALRAGWPAHRGRALFSARGWTGAARLRQCGSDPLVEQGPGAARVAATQPGRDELELALQTALGTSLVATEGYGALKTLLVYKRSQELGQRLGKPPSPPLLRALAITSISHAEFQQAHGLGDHLLSLAMRDRDPVLLVEGHYVLGVTLFWTGALVPSRLHLEQALAHYAPAQSATHLSLYTQDPQAVCLTGWPMICGFSAIRGKPSRRWRKPRGPRTSSCTRSVLPMR